MKLRFFNKLVVLCVAFSSLSLVSYAQANGDAADSLSKTLKKVSSFKAEFHQTVVDETGDLLEEYSGDIIVKRPGKLYWQSKQPFAQTLVSNSKKIWFYDQDLKQVTIRNASAALTETPALILSGNVDALKKKYAIKKVKQSDKQSIYVLTPLTKTGLFELLTLTLENGVFAQLQIKDSLQQITNISLYKLKSNVKVSDSKFNYKIPKGAKVIRDDKPKK